MKYFLLIYSLLILPFTLVASQDDISKSKGTTQDVIVQLMPSPAQEDVSRYTKIEASFNIPLNLKHVKKYDVKLTHLCGHKKHEYEKKHKHEKKHEYEKKNKDDKKCKKKIKGTVTYVETENKVTFTPKEALAPGLYEVEFKSLKADKAHKRTKIKKIKYRFIVEEKVLESMTVLPASIHLIEGETVQLTVTGKYDNGIEKDIMSKVEWVVGDTQTISVDDNGLATALKAGNITIQAKLTDVVEAGEIVSNTVPVEVLIPDVVPPIITLNGDAHISLSGGESYKELGASAADVVDGNVSVTITGNVDTSMVGTYTITYTAQDNIGNEATATRTVTVVAPILTSISLESNVTTLNVGEKAELTVMATYSDNSTKELDTDIEYIITPTGSVDVNGSILTAKKDSNVTVQAKVGTTLSNTLSFTIAWIVDGYTLPPEPDPTVNNATLGGVDSNNNGVRDDVERRIYEKYPVKLQRALMMDGATVFQQIMIRPADEAKETQKEVSRIIHCEVYLTNIDKDIDSDDWVEKAEEIKNLVFNNPQRVRKYLDYNIALSGGNFSSKPSDWNKGECSQETQNMLEEMGL